MGDALAPTLTKREELTAALALIGWSLRRRSPRGEYMSIFNHFEEPTAFMLYDDKLRCGDLPRSSAFACWGEKACEFGCSGSLEFDLSKCSIEVMNGCGVSVSTPDSAVFVSFYNHTLPYKP